MTVTEGLIDVPLILETVVAFQLSGGKVFSLNKRLVYLSILCMCINALFEICYFPSFAYVHA